MTIVKNIAEVAALISTISAALILFVRPLREKIFGLGQIKDGVKCLLREQMLSCYYRHIDDKQLSRYEYESCILAYSAYKALKGNSFVDKIKAEIESWEII